MFCEPTLQRNAARRRAARRGQSIVVALLVLLLLGLAGALFVTIVARNLLNARHASRVVTADQYARAGITFADAQLSNSLEGADWRPPLQTTLLNPPTEAREMARYNAAVTANALAAPNVNDPDARYLEAGFTRYNTGAGRFLLRVTYAPVLLKDSQGQYYDPVVGKDATTGVAVAPVSVPPGKYLKIESIGREGVIDPIDPTTYSNNRSSDRLQAYQVAYKPIGITDYARFETNPDNRSTTADMGVTSRYYQQDTDGGIITPGVFDFSNPTNSGVTLQPYPILTTYGAPDAYLNTGGVLTPNPNAGSSTKIATGGANAATLPGGGSFHANMPVRFFGKNIVYLNDAGVNAPLYEDGVEVAGDLLLNGYQSGVKPDNSNASGSGKQVSALILNPPDLSTLKTDGTNGTFIIPSNDPGGAGSNGGFNSHNELVRDGSSQNDITGLPRSIGRLEPPRMDAVESGSQLPRYKAIAVTSPPRTYADNTGAVQTAPVGSSQYGYGQSIYINNPNDIQQNSQSIGGGSTLVDEWLNRTVSAAGSTKGGWTKGDFYNPPGVNITLGRQNQLRKTAPASTFGIRMTLTSGDFPNPDGSAGSVATQTVLYDDINASNDPTTATSGNADNDVLIYAEGNVRVHGIASADPSDPDTKNVTAADKYPRHITIVTNGTAYIEGSLLKGNPDSSITILAHDYVCVNTTQFLAGPESDENPLGTPAPGGNADPAYHALAFGSDEPTLLQELNFGLPNGGTPGTAYPNSPLGLYVSARPGDTGATEAEFDIVNPATGESISGTGNAPFTTPFWSPEFGASAAVTPNTGQQYFNLSGLTDNSLATPTSLENLVESDTRLLETRRESNPVDTGATQDLELERVAVLPMDVRIEAVLYAQTGSFFVIPGPWFNSSPADTLDVFAQSVGTANLNGTRTFGADPHFPFYGQPIDMKITIDGAVSEAQPADVAVQTAWMLKWGWIPQYHGYASSGAGSGPPLEPAGHVLLNASNAPADKPAVGLQIIYNPQAGYPYSPGSSPHYLRSDAYGRPLPFSPKLPVSTGLLFAGESSEPPLLQ